MKPLHLRGWQPRPVHCRICRPGTMHKHAGRFHCDSCRYSMKVPAQRKVVVTLKRAA